MTDQWDEAARKAAEEIYSIMRDSFPSMERREYEHYITRNFADLRETHEKMVELVVATKEICRLLSGLHDASLSNGIRRNERISELIQIIGTIETNPLIKSAIEGREK